VIQEVKKSSDSLKLLSLDFSGDSVSSTQEILQILEGISRDDQELEYLSLEGTKFDSEELTDK
jgi:hypothetical protein